MMRVSGTLNGVPYQVQVTGDPNRPIAGSGALRVLLAQYSGKDILGSPTGPKIKVNGGDPASVLALLREKTTVTVVEGDLPEKTTRRPLAVE